MLHVCFALSVLQGLQRVKLKRVLVVHGCSSSAGTPVVLDFSDLQVRRSCLHCCPDLVP